MSNLIYKKMSDVMKDVGAIGKDQKNTAQGFKFRGIDQFVNALYPALTKHGVFMTPRATQFSQDLKDVTRSNGKAGVDKHVAIMMEYDFYAEDGSKVTVGPVPAEGLDSGDKATNKALSAALKYALIQTFSIPTEDMAEADFDSPEIGRHTKDPTPEKPAYIKPTPTPTAGASVTVTTSSGAEASVSQAIVATEPLPQGSVQAIATTGLVEPMKKSSFRKPGKKTEAPVSNGATQETAWDN
jgi:hypothetical protein